MGFPTIIQNTIETTTQTTVTSNYTWIILSVITIIIFIIIWTASEKKVVRQRRSQCKWRFTR